MNASTKPKPDITAITGSSRQFVWLASICGVAAVLFVIECYVPIGQIINVFSPCVQNEANSMPCHAGYDVMWMMILIAVFVVCLISAVINRVVALRR